MIREAGRVILYRLLLLLLLLVLVLIPVQVLAEEPPLRETIKTLPMASVSAAPEVIFADNFRSNKAGWSEKSDNTVRRHFKDSGYHMAILQPNQMAFSTFPTGKLGDFVLQVDASMISGGNSAAYGIGIRAQDFENFYMFGLIGSNEFRVDKVKDLKYTDTMRNEPVPAKALRSSTLANTMKIVAKGKIIDMYLNEVKVASLTDETYKTGSVFFFVSSQGNLPSAEARFSTLTIWDTAVDPTPASNSVSRGKLLFDDDFTTDAGGWRVADEENASFWYEVDDTYHIAVLSPSMLAWSSLPGRYDDFVLEVDCAILDGTHTGQAGILFRFQDRDNFYRFGISGSGDFSLFKKQAGKWITLLPWTYSKAVYEADQLNNIVVVAKGSDFSIYANETFLGSATDKSFPAGYAAIYGGSFENADFVDVQFEYVGVWELETSRSSVPTPAPTLIRPAAKVLFSDDFTSNSAGWNITSTQDYSRTLGNGTYQIIINRPGYMVWSAAPISETTDFVAQVETAAKNTGGDAASGLLFRYQDSDNYYQFMVDFGGAFSITSVKNGKNNDLTPAINTSASIKTRGEANVLRVVAKGQIFDFYANGAKLATIRDATYTSGRLTLIAVNPGSSSQAEASFSKLRVWDSVPV